MLWSNPGPNSTWCPVCKQWWMDYQCHAHPVRVDKVTLASSAEWKRYCKKGHELCAKK